MKPTAVPSKLPPDRIWLQWYDQHNPDAPVTAWVRREPEADDTEYVRADLHTTNAALAVCEAVLHLYSPTGTWLGEEMRESGADPYPRLWRLVQLVTNTPRPNGRWAPYEGLLRELAAAMTGRSITEVTGPLSEVLHRLRYKQFEDVEGMVVTELDAWDYDGEDGG